MRHLANSKALLERSRGEVFEVLSVLRPVLAQESREAAIGEQLSTGLAGRTVIGLIRCITNPLYLPTATRTRLLVAAVDCHLGAKSRHLFRKLVARIDTQAFRP